MTGSDPSAATLQRLTLDSPSAVLDRYVAAEQVHPIDGDDDLRRRLDPADRRVFGLFHPDLVVAVSIALTDGPATSIQALLAPRSGEPPEPDTATFYSIVNGDPAVRGRGYGRELLERVRAELRPLGCVTLSPVPGLREWAEAGGRSTADLEGLCRAYLATTRDDGRPIDPVARFHLRNGARLDAVRLDADTSERGHERSYGVMVNYRYP